VTWTFGPLVRRNAYFNLVKLGATAVAFHKDF
jgi:predicted GNAT superfamily acetyltransferase